MLFYAIPLSLSGDKENKKSLGSSVASDIRYKETTKETMRGSISNQEEEEEDTKEKKTILRDALYHRAEPLSTSFISSFAAGCRPEELFDLPSET